MTNAAQEGAQDTFNEVDEAIWRAILNKMDSRPENFLFEAYDWELSGIKYNADRTTAIVWLDPLDPLTGITIATEPMLVIVSSETGQKLDSSSSWKIAIQGDESWNDTALGALDLLPQELSDSMTASVPQSPEAPLVALGGYKLPWAAGLTKSLVWSAEHTSCPGDDCVYAFDFADGTMFPLLAAKGGVVYAAKDDCENGATDCTNYLVIEDVSTTPKSYQLYWHLAHDSIPSNLHVGGALISQGQYIGNVDDTGYSSGHHLHFMVHTSSYPLWGTAVDITFKDVFINWDPVTQGGRPRTEAGAAILGGDWQTDYTSGNIGANPPTGGLTLPADKLTVIGSSVQTSGWGSDNLGVTRLQLIAFFQDAWHEVGAPQTANPFNYALDVCSTGIPTGPFDLALRVWDVEGNQSALPLGTRHLVNTINCPETAPPVCIPNSYQVAIYSGINFTGRCKLLGIGNHDNSQFSPVLNNDVASLMVGQYVQIRMYDGEAWSNRRETLTSSDRNLADNPIGADRLSAATVQLRTLIPNLELDGTDPHGPSAAPPTTVDSITVTWRADGATKYQSRIFTGSLSSADDCAGGTPYLSRLPDWSIFPSWSIGSLPEGDYSWCARGRIAEFNGTPHYSSWQMKHFTVTVASFGSQTVQYVPYQESVESGLNGWTASGLWRQVIDPEAPGNHVWVCNNIDGDYADSTYGGGDLTSPPIQVPAGGATLRFDYRYETESTQSFWDQRWVQISENGGRFQNLIQLSDDRMDASLQSPVIDLSDFAGSIIRIRFHFNIVDKHYNGGLSGWLVDNIIVSAPQSEGCEESDNNSTATASTLAMNSDLTATICPAGDVDYYRFSASAGTKLIARVDASIMTPASALDPFLLVLDQDQYGNSQLFENDDLQPGVLTDSRIYFTIPETGNYYLKVKSADHPTSGGNDAFYRVSLSEQTSTSDTTPPDLYLVYPGDLDGVPSAETIFSAIAQDSGSGLERVEFWWHTPDWDPGQWILLAADAFGDDGWQAAFDGSGLTEGQVGAVTAIAYDYEGNARAEVAWNVWIDDTPPTTNLLGLAPITDGTGIFLTWLASDPVSRLGLFDFQVREDDSDWNTWRTEVPGDRRSIWFIGEPGHQYSFRMRGSDSAGNIEIYPPEAETGTLTATGCTPDGYDALGDQVSSQATLLGLNEYQQHVFCAGDVDWFTFAAEAGKTYMISIQPPSGSPLGGSLELYQTDESQWLINAIALEPGLPVVVRWQAPADGVYLLRVTPMDARIFGNNALYSIRVGDGWWFSLPSVYR